MDTVDDSGGDYPPNAREAGGIGWRNCDRSCPRDASLRLDRSRPDFRDLYGELLSDSTALDGAIWRIRLAGLHLPLQALEEIGRIRIVVGSLEAIRLAAEAEALALAPRRRPTVQTLISLMGKKRLLIRSAPLGGWAPDFSIFHTRSGPTAVLVGPHWLERPYPHRGPAITSYHRGADALQLIPRFEQLWQSAHDVRAAVLDTLREAVSRCPARSGP